MNNRMILAALLVATGAGCTRYASPRPIRQDGQMIEPRAEQVVAQARYEGEAERQRIEAERAAIGAAALSACAPAVCEAVTRGELSLGMTETQVLAATRTTHDAWDVRAAGGATVMTPRHGAHPGDAQAQVAFVNLQGGAVRSYTYREPQGFRTVATPADATAAGRAAALADALVREGDDYAARGDLERALDRYDRADVLRANHPETTLRIASTLDKQLRPLEAVMRYQLFIHQLELEKIHARGEAAARMAEAIALAQQRIIVLDRR
jgi:tetratricopeptide (TPR) repeat protein